MTSENASEALLDRLPHRPPMRLLDRALLAETGKAICACDMDTLKAALFSDGRGGILSCIGIELVAQAAALCLAATPQVGQPQGGRLVMVKSFACQRPSLELGREARVEVEIADPTPESPFALATGKVFQAGSLACEATVLLALQAAD